MRTENDQKVLGGRAQAIQPSLDPLLRFEVQEVALVA